MARIYRKKREQPQRTRLAAGSTAKDPNSVDTKPRSGPKPPQKPTPRPRNPNPGGNSTLPTKADRPAGGGVSTLPTRANPPGGGSPQRDAMIAARENDPNKSAAAAAGRNPDAWLAANMGKRFGGDVEAAKARAAANPSGMIAQRMAAAGFGGGMAPNAGKADMIDNASGGLSTMPTPGQPPGRPRGIPAPPMGGGMGIDMENGPGGPAGPGGPQPLDAGGGSGGPGGGMPPWMQGMVQGGSGGIFAGADDPSGNSTMPTPGQPPGGRMAAPGWQKPSPYGPGGPPPIDPSMLSTPSGPPAGTKPLNLGPRPVQPPGGPMPVKRPMPGAGRPQPVPRPMY